MAFNTWQLFLFSLILFKIGQTFILFLFLKARNCFASCEIQVPVPQRTTVRGQIWAAVAFGEADIQPFLKWKHKSRHPSIPRQGHEGCMSCMGLVLPPGANFTHRDFRNAFSNFIRKFCLLRSPHIPGGVKKKHRYGTSGHSLADMVLGWRLDLMILEVFSNLNDSVIPSL